MRSFIRFLGIFDTSIGSQIIPQEFNHFHRVSDPSTGIIPQDIRNFPRNPGTSTGFQIISQYFKYFHSISDTPTTLTRMSGTSTRFRYFHRISIAFTGVQTLPQDC
jgi:hypothetical protein